VTAARPSLGRLASVSRACGGRPPFRLSPAFEIIVVDDPPRDEGDGDDRKPADYYPFEHCISIHDGLPSCREASEPLIVARQQVIVRTVGGGAHRDQSD
jgi:hypothetical protein